MLLRTINLSIHTLISLFKCGDQRKAGTQVGEMNLSEATVRLPFRKGHNSVLFKLYTGSASMFFSLVVAK